jgi:hypothetical protein
MPCEMHVCIIACFGARLGVERLGGCIKQPEPLNESAPLGCLFCLRPATSGPKLLLAISIRVVHGRKANAGWLAWHRHRHHGGVVCKDQPGNHLAKSARRLDTLYQEQISLADGNACIRPGGLPKPAPARCAKETGLVSCRRLRKQAPVPCDHWAPVAGIVLVPDDAFPHWRETQSFCSFGRARVQIAWRNDGVKLKMDIQGHAQPVSAPATAPCYAGPVSRSTTVCSLFDPSARQLRCS